MYVYMYNLIYDGFLIAYKITYGNHPVWKEYRRNHKGSIPPSKTRKTCIVCYKLYLSNYNYYIFEYFCLFMFREQI